MIRRSFLVRALMAFVHDLTATCLAWLAAFWLRFNLEVPPEFMHTALGTMDWVLLANAVLFWRFGLYRGLWRYASLPDLRRILAAIGVASLAAPALLALIAPVPP